MKLINVTFTGDLMCDSDVILKNMDKEFFSKMVLEKFQNSDYVITNLETPIVENNVPLKQKYVFSAPKQFASKLKEDGIDFVSTANNHCLDCGYDGVVENIQNLDEIGLEHSGTYSSYDEKGKIFIKDLNGIKISILSYTYGTNAFINQNYVNKNNGYLVNLLKKQETSNKLFRKIKYKFFENVYFYNSIRDYKYLKSIKKDIRNAKKHSDYLIFCLHSGGQYNKKVDHYTKGLSKFLIKNGVDIVIGNHPHVILDSFCENNKFVFYSLGNFYATPFSNHNQIDDFPDYSILLNFAIDCEKREIVKIKYSILKTILEDGIPKTCNISELYNSSNDKQKIECDVKKITKILGKQQELVQDEYVWEIFNK